MKDNNLKRALETVNEEREDENNYCGCDTNCFCHTNNNSISNNHNNFKSCSKIKDNNEKQSTIYDTGFMLSPIFLEKGVDNCSRDLHFRSAIFATPIMVVNQIRSSFESNDKEFLTHGHRKSVCISEQSRSGSTIIHNLKRASVTSNQISGKHIWYGISLGTLIIMTTIIATLMIIWRPHPQSKINNGKSEFCTHIHIKWDATDLITTKSVFFLVIAQSWYVKRSDWSARPPKNKTYLTLPVNLVLIGATNTKMVTTKAECIQEISHIQKQHMDKNGSDIAYNFLICGKTGLVFEGRGPLRMGSHTRGFNSRSIMIALVGKFNETVHASEDMLNRVDGVLEYLKNANILSPKFLVLGKTYISNDINGPLKHIIQVLNNLTNWNPMQYYIN